MAAAYLVDVTVRDHVTEEDAEVPQQDRVGPWQRGDQVLYEGGATAGVRFVHLWHRGVEAGGGDGEAGCL